MDEKETTENIRQGSRSILTALDPKGLDIDPREFCRGLEVEIEHGMQFKNANVTNNHPLLTGLIVAAHFKETLDTANCSRWPSWKEI